MAGNLILPVPDQVSAVYLVPGSLSAEAARIRAEVAVSAWADGQLAAAVSQILASPRVTFSAQQASALPALPISLQEHLGAAEEQVRAVTSARDLLVLRATYAPGWPPLHEWSARGGAGTLSSELGVPLVDAFIPRVLSADQAIDTLPNADGQVCLADWVLVFQSPGALGIWTTTKGLGRFGLPELQIYDVPPDLAGPCGHLLTGLASRLITLWTESLRQDPEQEFVELPAEIEVSEADVAYAYRASPRGGGGALVRLAAEPAADGDRDRFLTVLPPDGYPGSTGEHLADVCAELFGAAEPDPRWLPPSQRMEQAISAARQSLPQARARLMTGELPLGARLMIRHRVSTANGDEYVWVHVTSWRTPETALGYSAGDAVGDPSLRVGRPVLIEPDTIVDWAIWTDSSGIIEGGWTEHEALNKRRPGPDSAPMMGG